MLKLLLLVTPQIDSSHQIGEAWQRAGASGVTFVEVHGLFRMQQMSHTHDLLPGTLSLMSILRQNEQHNILMFSVVRSDQVEALRKATESIIGDINQAHNGIMFVLDVEQAFGLRSQDD